MNTSEITALVVAVTAAAAALLAGMRDLRGDKFSREVSSSTALLTGYKDMVDSLDKRLAGAEKALEGEREERAQDRREHAEEREQWAKERRELHKEIDELRESIDRLVVRGPQSRSRREDKGDMR